MTDQDKARIEALGKIVDLMKQAEVLVACVSYTNLTARVMIQDINETILNAEGLVKRIECGGTI